MSIWGPDITIADQDGTNPVDLVGNHAPYPIPRPVAEYDVEIIQMRRGGADLPGYRVAQIGGASQEEQDIEFQVKLITPEQLAALETKYFRQPPEPVAYTLDGGTNWALAVFQRNGLVVSNWEEDWEKQSAEIRLHRIGSVTID